VTAAGRSTAWVIAVLVICAAALVVVASRSDRGAESRGAATARERAGTSLPMAHAAGPPMTVRYAGPRHISGRTTLRARVVKRSARPVAVTFLLDGEPLGTDTEPPFALDVESALLPRGRHRLAVAAVDALGRRFESRRSRVRVGPGSVAILTATPTRGLDAALAALARGHVTVRLGPGRYVLDHLELGSGARLVGDGRDTVLAAAGGAWSLITVRGRAVRVSDLVVDGAGKAERAIGVASGSHDVRVQRVRIEGITETGVEVWGEHSEISVQDSVIAGAGARGAGVFELGSEASRAMSVVRTRISGFRSHGINFAQREYDRPNAALHGLALDNRISDIDDPAAATGTHEGGIWSGGVAAAIIGNRVRDTGWDGIQTVGSSTRTTIVDNSVTRTRVGIYLEHETNDTLIEHNAIADVVTGINAEWRYDGAGSGSNTYARNIILRPSEAGIFIDVAGDRNRLVDNMVASGAGPAVVLQGASDNVVTGTAACDRAGEPIVVQRSAHFDDGRAAHSLRNVFERNGERCTTR
jgi:Periplasmic copper-binding protein (NosD)